MVSSFAYGSALGVWSCSLLSDHPLIVHSPFTCHRVESCRGACDTPCSSERGLFLHVVRVIRKSRFRTNNAGSPARGRNRQTDSSCSLAHGEVKRWVLDRILLCMWQPYSASLFLSLSRSLERHAFFTLTTAPVPTTPSPAPFWQQGRQLARWCSRHNKHPCETRLIFCLLLWQCVRFFSSNARCGVFRFVRLLFGLLLTVSPRRSSPLALAFRFRPLFLFPSLLLVHGVQKTRVPEAEASHRDARQRQ